jgi:anaerobic selenocysteine-containing dehydrogenase
MEYSHKADRLVVSLQADHKVECRMIALSNAVSDENILRDPTNVRFLEVAKNWLNTYAGEDIAFAAASAFKLTNYYKPVDLIDTHFLLLFTEFVKEEILPRNQVKLFDAALVKTSDFLAGKDGYALNTLRKDVESFLKLPTI